MSTTLLIGRWPASAEPLLHPLRRRPDSYALDHRRDVARAQVGVVDADGDGLRGGWTGLEVAGRGDAHLARAGDRGDLPRDADHVHRVGAVRPDVYVEYNVPEVVRERRTDRRVGGQFEDALVLVAQPELALRQHHARRLEAADLRRLEHGALARVAVEQLGTLAREGDALPHLEVRRAADDLLRLGVRPVAHRREAQAVGVRVRVHRHHLADGHERAVPRPDPMDRIHLGGGHGQPVRQVVDVVRQVDVVAQPLQ